MIIAKLVACVVVGYFLGSIPVGYLVAKWTARVDVRQYGSGKIGTTNVLRTAGKKAAVVVVAGDLAKGMAAVLVAGAILGNGYLAVGGFGLGQPFAQTLAALAAVAGHNWPVFLKFRGGRGVATYFGALAVLLPMAALFGGEILFIGALTTRFMSLGSIAGVVGSYAMLVPLTIIGGFPLEYLVYALVGALIIVFMHRGNIARLLAGKERRLGEKAEKLPDKAEKLPDKVGVSPSFDSGGG